MTTARGASLLSIALLLFAGRAGAGSYPSPLPDFAHPDQPHFGDVRYSPVGGHTHRPILVIYPRWDDVDYPAGLDATAMATRFFGTGFPSITFPSVGDYFRRLSFNDLFLFPAAETQGTFDDGVVQVSVPGTKADFFTLSERARNKRVLELADPYVDFSSFDTDGDRAVTNLELIVNVVESTDLPMPQGCGINRGVDPLSLDGVNLSALQLPMTNTATNLITQIHENAHAALGMVDLYGFDVGNFDIGAATCGGPDDMLFAPNAWNKVHWGWISPTVATRDGYVEIRRADTTGDAFILYDPDRGPDDYFIIENRRPTPGTYDQSVADDGLIIWRVADAALGISTPIELVRPAPGKSSWDASSTSAPQRTMTQTWLDGTPSRVAVRAIGAKGEVMRAYLDVLGPGILVDTYPVDAAAPPKVVAGGSSIVDVPVMNTGETGCDTFVFEPVDLPAGWTMSPGARILCAGESTFARMTISPDANAAVGVQPISIRGHSQTDPSVQSQAPLSVELVLRSTRFGLAQLLAVSTTGASTTFVARLTDADDPSASDLGGIPVTFTLAVDGAPDIILTATTDADGVATATTELELPPGSYTLTLDSPRQGALAPAHATVAYQVLTVEDTLQYVADQLDPLITSAPSRAARFALQRARDGLVGAADGRGGNGALDQLQRGNGAVAILDLNAVLAQLSAAEQAGVDDLGQLETLAKQAIEVIESDLQRAHGHGPNRG